MFSFFNSLTNITANHQRNVSTKDANGGDVAAWTTINADIKVAIGSIDTELREDYARRDIQVTHEVICLSDLDAKPRDRIKVGSDYYVVMGLAPEENSGIFAHPIYTMHCQRRHN